MATGVSARPYHGLAGLCCGRSAQRDTIVGMGRRSVLDYLDNFLQQGQACAYIQRRGYRSVRWSYRQVAETAFQFARDLEQRGIGKSDRVLLWGFYVVPQWTYGKVRTARWDRFGRPDELPKYGAPAFPTVWWWDAEKAAKTGTRQ